MGAPFWVIWWGGPGPAATNRLLLWQLPNYNSVFTESTNSPYGAVVVVVVVSVVVVVVVSSRQAGCVCCLGDGHLVASQFLSARCCASPFPPFCGAPLFCAKVPRLLIASNASSYLSSPVGSRMAPSLPSDESSPRQRADPKYNRTNRPFSL
ncbi:hypothetical protein BO71DRAFT_40749 [Aspergillus ellipticus CBS 707.79]|uniref:Uncharacterized protein n=1 Tax=Aspergillus ellipticus CBS 707.79 TaxID=1448320 RepID=A0A319DMC2_9EURO|nr:hypothetical protein BO71DRAFT_40749 [Aspergillus ellipticus CBS 707.79]